MYTNHYIFLIIIVVLSSCNNNQSSNTTSSRLKTILDIQEIAKNNPDSFLTDLKNAEKLIKMGGISDSIKGENDFMIGRRYARSGALDSAATYFYNATEYVKKPLTARRYNDYFYFAWNIHSRLGKYGDCIAISDRFKSLINADDHQRFILAYFMDNNAYIKAKDHNKALESNLLRIESVLKSKDSSDLLPALLSQAESRYYLNEKKKAFEILDDLVAKVALLDLGTKRKLFTDYAVFLFEEGDYKKSYSYNLKSITYKKLLRSNEKNRVLATGYSNTAEVCIELKEYKKAAVYIDSAKALGLPGLNRTTQKEVLLHQLKLNMLTRKDPNNVIGDLKSIFEFQDNSYEEKYGNELVALAKANENEKVILQEKQDAEIRSLRLQSRQQFFILLAGLLSLIGSLFYRQRKLKFERQQLQMQQRLLRSQMNPHFTSNTLYSIQNLVKQTPELANKYLLKFSRLLRLVLENSISNYVQLEDELETLTKYLDLQLLRYESKFTYDIILSNMEADDLIFIPPMLIQPIVENSIEHGILNNDDQGKIKITLNKKNKFIECSIEDNGKGLSQNTSTIKQSTSTKLINDFLRKTTKSGLKVINKNDIDTNQTGVLVTFLIPYKLTDDD